MMYATIALFTAAFGAGFWAGDRYELANTQRLQLGIVQANLEAENELQAAKNRTLAAEHAAQQLNQQIEASHAQAVTTVNALLARVQSTRRQDCTNPVSAGSRSAVAADQAADITRLDRFTRLSGSAAAYAEACWQFVTHNCGIAQ